MKLEWPSTGDKIKTKDKFQEFFYPHFTDMVEDGMQNLEPNKLYTVKRCEVYSSWCAVWLEELPDTEERGDRFFNLTFFDWDPEVKEEKDIIMQTFLDNGLNCARLIGYSKSRYRSDHPNDEVYFNANIFTEKHGKVWWGDLNLTSDRKLLEKVACELNEDLYMIREHDGRFNNEELDIEQMKEKAVAKISCEK